MLASLSRSASALSAKRGSRWLCTSAVKSELALLEKLIATTQERLKAAEAGPAPAAEESSGAKFQVQTFNAISPAGLNGFPKGQFMLTGSSGSVPDGVEEEPHTILLRSHKLKSEEVGSSVRAIARCGAGTNNIPIDEMTKRGIPVFNTPGANANAVKELVLCSLLLASRGIVEGINHVKTKLEVEEPDHASIAAKIEKDKKHFVGGELAGKTLAVCGLGNIGAMVAEAGIALGMKVVGYDPKISVEAAWRLPNSVVAMGSLEAAFAEADFVSINMPYIKGVTHHAISESVLSQMKPTCSIVNMARAEIVDGAALKRIFNKGHLGKYICDFADEHMQDHPKFVCIPHLGASTEEAEDNCAKMAAAQVINFLETGTIKNSVNFPAASLDKQSGGSTRLCIITNNVPGVLGEVTTLLGSKGVNITQQLNTSRDAIAYNVIDMDGFSEENSDDLQNSLLAIDAVLSTRLIWTGSASEGPSNFFSKDMEICG